MSFEMLCDAVFLLVGLYVLYIAVKLRRSGNPADMQWLLPEDAKLTDCHDAEGFIDDVMPSLVAFGAITTLDGALGLLEDVELIGLGWVRIVLTALFFAAMVVFLMAERKAVRLNWFDRGKRK